MIPEEFKLQRFGPNMKAKYMGNIYAIGSVNFIEMLVGMDDGSEDFIWARCENIEIMPSSVNQKEPQ